MDIPCLPASRLGDTSNALLGENAPVHPQRKPLYRGDDMQKGGCKDILYQQLILPMSAHVHLYPEFDIVELDGVSSEEESNPGRSLFRMFRCRRSNSEAIGQPKG